MIGNSWWSDVTRRAEEPKLCPPRVVVSISGEPAPQEGSIEGTSATGKAFDVSDPPTGTTYIGRCVGKQLFISDVDEKKKKVEALVKRFQHAVAIANHSVVVRKRKDIPILWVANS